MSQNGNPLIGSNKGDTIAGTYKFVEWMCLSSDSDDLTHPGMTAALQLVLGALASLKEPENGEKI